MASEQELELQLEVGDADAAELARLTRQLRGQLEQLDVDAVLPLSRGPAPEGSKALDWAMLGGLLVQLGPAAIAAVVQTVQSWVARDANRSVTIRKGKRELVVTNVSREQQDRLIEAFLTDTDG